MDSQVGVELFSNIADINSLYEEALSNLRDRVPVQSTDQKNRARMDAEKEQAAKDYYASVRTNVLLAWVLSNVGYRTMVSLFVLSYVALGVVAIGDPWRCFCVNYI